MIVSKPMANNALTQNVWRTRGAMLLDEIGPAIFMTHGDGSVFAWVTAQERPNLVKGIVAVEQPSTSMNGQALTKLSKIPIAIVTAEASGNTSDPGIAASLLQAGASVEQIRLSEHGVRGNGPMLMMEKNNREALQPILEWMKGTESGIALPAVVELHRGILWSGIYC